MENVRLEDIKPGMRVRLVKMDDSDPKPISPGSWGTIKKVNDLGDLMVNWDDGRTLNLIQDYDEYEVYPSEEESITDITSVLESEGNIKMKNIPKVKPVTKQGKAIAKSFKSKISSVNFNEEEEVETDLVDTDIEETTSAASAGSYSKPLFSNENFVITKDKLINEITNTKNTDLGSGSERGYDGDTWADLKDGWSWKDKPQWEGGAIVDPLAKEKVVWDDKTLSINPDYSIEDYGDSAINTITKEDVIKRINLINEKFVSKKQQKYFYSKCNDGKLKPTEKKKWCDMAKEFSSKTDFSKIPEKKETKEGEDLEETTTTASSGQYSVPAFAATNNKNWRGSKKPIWNGGTIVQKVHNDGVLNPVNEINNIKWTKGSKFVKIKDKCTKYNNQPWCSEGDLDKPLELSNKTVENVKNISTKLGISEEFIMKQIKKVLKKK